mmetsp:Transcript_9987/g.45606  ORF Transcript_9987/g.45606 Transcript_9987/m.45606 type:complete len:773 (-) Transcript_9987:1659-3977(-)
MTFHILGGDRPDVFLDPRHLKVVDEAMRETRLAVGEIKLKHAQKLAAVPESENGLSPVHHALAPQAKRHRVVFADVVVALQLQPHRVRRAGHGSHGGQVPTRENVGADEVALALAVALVTLVRHGDDLDGSLTTRLERTGYRVEVPREVFVTHSLEHLDGYHAVVHAPLVAVVPNDDVHPVLHASSLDPRLGLRVLLVADGQSRDLQAGISLRHADRAGTPPAANLQDGLAAAVAVEPESVDHRVNLGVLSRLQVLLPRVEVILRNGTQRGSHRARPRIEGLVDTRGVEHGLVQEELVERVTRVVVVLDVLLAPLLCVAQRGVSGEFHLGAEPVQHTAGHPDDVASQGRNTGVRSLARARVRGVPGAEHVQQLVQFAVKLPVHVRLAETYISPQHSLHEHPLVEHLHRHSLRERLAVHGRAEGLAGGQSLAPHGEFIAVGQDHPEASAGGYPRPADASEEGKSRLGGPVQVGVARPRVPRHRTLAEHLVRHVHGGPDPILVEPVTAPRAAEPNPARALKFLDCLLRRDCLFIEKWMRECDVVLRRLLGRYLRRVEGDEEVGCTLGQVLEQVHPVRDAHGLIPRVAPARALEAVPTRPSVAVLGHQRLVTVEVHLVRLVLDRTQRVLLRLGRVGTQDGEGLVGVAREDDVLEELHSRLVATTPVRHLDAARDALHGYDRGGGADVREGGAHRVHVRLGPAFDHPPQRTLDDVQQVVVNPEPDERHDWKLHGVLVRARPDGGAHGDDVVVNKERGVPVLGEVLTEGHGLVLGGL